MRYSFQLRFRRSKAPHGLDPSQGPRPAEPAFNTVVFIALSAEQSKLQADWAEAGVEGIVRNCPSACKIRWWAMAVARNKLMTYTTTGSRSGAASAIFVVRR